ncbi:protein TUNAR isoform X2 [Equus asinus]|uniref:protein TUNAR isoform X2 n=1 Tax=Equus asinus TaxID=9793 RepID=UPI0038F66E97
MSVCSDEINCWPRMVFVHPSVMLLTHNVNYEETKASRVFIAAYKTPPDSGFEHQSSFILLTSPGAAGAQVSLGRKIKTFATKMVITSGNDEDRGGQEKESKEESVLAMLGIIGTILNLIVIIFVYIYTTL